MLLRDKFVSEISPAEILDVIAQRTAEDDYVDFKKEILHPKKPHKVLEEDKEDLMADVAAFANASGGLILIGVGEDLQGRAYNLAPMTGDEAKKLADSIRDLAAAHINRASFSWKSCPFK